MKKPMNNDNLSDKELFNFHYIKLKDQKVYLLLDDVAQFILELANNNQVLTIE